MREIVLDMGNAAKNEEDNSSASSENEEDFDSDISVIKCNLKSKLINSRK